MPVSCHIRRLAVRKMRRSLSGAWGVVAILAIALVTLVPAAGAQTTAVLVKDIFPGSQGSFPLSLTNINGTLFFSANFSGDGVTFDGRELWKSDGTAAGTVLVKDIRPGTMSSLEEEFPTTFVTVGGTFFFRADDGINGRELWKSDGTAAGTVLVKNINPGCCDTFGNGFNSSPGGVPPEFTDVSGTLFFSASDGTAGRELWKSDGTAAGTVLVKDIQPGTFPGGQLRNGLPQFLTNLNGTLVFGADDGINGRELWKSDGTGAGTVLLKDINPGAGSAVPFETSPFESGPTSFFNNVNGMLFFRADDGTTGRELWKSDGTAAGTVRVKDINPGTPGSAPQFLTDMNGTLFFGADDGTTGIELWKSDGTAAGTVRVKDVNPGLAGSGLRFLTDMNGTLFFRADDGSHGRELWQSDGTEAGTVLVQDIWPGPDSALPLEAAPTNFLANVNGTLFFHANDGTNGAELWKTEGGGGGGLPAADLSLTKADSPDPVTVGGTLTYTLTVANAGPGDASDVTVTDNLPASVTFVSATASQGSCSQSAGTVTCSVGTVASGGTATVTIVVTPNSAGTITNGSSVGASTNDPNAANNSDSEDTGVTAIYRPDGKIKLATDASYLGNNVYNTTGVNQTRTVKARRGATKTFNIAVQNDGNSVDSFKLKGRGSTTEFTVKYLAGLSGTTNITTAVVNGTYTMSNVGAGGTKYIRMRITVRSAADIGDVFGRLVTATSTHATTVKDAVKGVVKVVSG